MAAAAAATVMFFSSRPDHRFRRERIPENVSRTRPQHSFCKVIFFEFLFLKQKVQKLALFFGGSFFKILSPSTLWSSLWPLSLSLL
jgi:hypothetical protein